MSILLIILAIVGALTVGFFLGMWKQRVLTAWEERDSRIPCVEVAPGMVYVAGARVTLDAPVKMSPRQIEALGIAELIDNRQLRRPGRFRQLGKP